MSDALNRSLDQEGNFTLTETITDVNKLYSKSAIEKYGLVREGR